MISFPGYLKNKLCELFEVGGCVLEAPSFYLDAQIMLFQSQ
jgi:hypothetical protein